MRADCLDDDLAHRWQVVVDVHHGKAVVDEYRKAHEKDLPPGASVWAYLADPDQEVTEPEFSQAYDPEKAEAEYQAQQRRHEQTN